MANYEMLLSLASKVEAHIRFEERELFPYIESQLSMEELDEMGKLISDLHQPYLETYENAFWTR
jgi:hemerythrin-like domain-containing protein